MDSNIAICASTLPSCCQCPGMYMSPTQALLGVLTTLQANSSAALSICFLHVPLATLNTTPYSAFPCGCSFSCFPAVSFCKSSI